MKKKLGFVLLGCLIIYNLNGQICSPPPEKYEYLIGPITLQNPNKLTLNSYSWTETISPDTLNNKLELNTSDFGGLFSIGVSVGGGGLVNIPFRIFPAENFAFELTPGLKPVIDLNNDKVYLNIALVGGLTYYFTKDYIQYKNKVRMNGLFIKGGGSIGGRYNEILFGAGWSHEKFKVVNPNRSFNFELGFGIIRLKDTDYYLYEIGSSMYEGTAEEFFWQPALFWRIAWHFFVVK